MRLSCLKVFTILFLILISSLIWNLLSKQEELSFKKTLHLLFNQKRNQFKQTCNLRRQYQEDLHFFTDRVHKILYNLNVTHFLCYGSLWGQIRLSRLLPWEDKSVMCLLNEDITKKDELMVASMFKRQKYYLSYDGSEGAYIITKLNRDEKMKVILRVFEMDKVMHKYRRIGWKRRILPPDCKLMESLDCFPPELIIPPLQMKEFGGYLLPVPREGIEIQKYHFIDDWWKEVPIKNC